jgi:hypothetical protein
VIFIGGFKKKRVRFWFLPLHSLFLFSLSFSYYTYLAFVRYTSRMRVTRIFATFGYMEYSGGKDVGVLPVTHPPPSQDLTNITPLAYKEVKVLCKHGKIGHHENPTPIEKSTMDLYGSSMRQMVKNTGKHFSGFNTGIVIWGSIMRQDVRETIVQQFEGEVLPDPYWLVFGARPICKNVC